MKPDTLRKAVAGVNGTSFISLDTCTGVRLVGGNRNDYQGHVQKHTTGLQVMVFNNPAFERIVNRRLVAEGIHVAYKAGPRSWGTRVEGLPLVEHEGKLYLEVILLRPGVSIYTWKSMPVDEATIPGLPNDRPSDVGVMLRVYESTSIKRLVINGKEWK